MAEKKQNYYLNFWKGIACFGVVFFHTRFPVYHLDGVLQTMFRFAVPLFFMISGYFCYKEDRNLVEKKLPAKMKRIFWINFVGCLGYFLMQIAIALLGDSHGSVEDLIARIHTMFNKETMIKWLVFNEDPFIHIMWFTSALLYCYLLFWVVNHFNLYQLGYGLIPVFIVVHFLFGNVLIAMEIEKVYYRNFLLFGFPFFMLGNWLCKNRSKVLEKVNEKKGYTVLVCGVLLGFLEWFLLGRHEMYFGTLLVLAGIFTLSMKFPEKKEKSFITKIGNEYSLFIYVTHSGLMVIMERFAEKIFVPGTVFYYIYYFARPFIIFGTCIIMAWIFYKIWNMFQKRYMAK